MRVIWFDKLSVWLRGFLLVVGFCSFLSAPGVAGELMYAVTATGNQSGTLLSVDIQTGATQIIGPQGMGFGAGLRFTGAIAARPSDGELFVDCNGGSLAYYGLLRVDRATGLATVVGQNSNLNELAFDTAGNLYSQIAPDQIGATGPIGIVNQSNGTITPLGGPNIARLFGLAYNPADGFLNGLSADADLLKLSLQGEQLSTVHINFGLLPGAIVFDRNGVPVCSDLSNNLFDINLNTGAISNVRAVPGGFKIQGLAPAIPEPSTIFLAVVAFATLSTRRRKSVPHNRV